MTVHRPVLLNEICDWLAIEPGSTIVDGTFGGGGHARILAEKTGINGLVVGCDRDPSVMEIAARSGKFSGLPIKLAHSSYAQIPEILDELGISTVQGVLLDLGLSSDQLEDHERGFSYTSTGKLDLRFDPEKGKPAWQLLERISADHLADIIFEFGEERYSRRIARKIVDSRRSQPIRTSKALADLVLRCVPSKPGRDRIHPATRTFQALRIAVNDELQHLEHALKRLPDRIAPGGRFAIISFHSLEDRRVKQAFRNDTRLNILTKKPVLPSEGEIGENPRSRSAKLRVAERIENE